MARLTVNEVQRVNIPTISTQPAETNSDFGFNLPCWDYIFNTYCAQPDKGHKNMTVGLIEYQCEKELALPKLLLQPFTKQ